MDLQTLDKVDGHTKFLWSLIALDLIVGAGMSLVAAGRINCDQPLCSLSTFGGREMLLAGVAFGAAALTAALAWATDRLSRTGPWTLPTLYLLGGVSLGVAAGLLLTVAVALWVVVLVLKMVAGVAGGGE